MCLRFNAFWLQLTRITKHITEIAKKKKMKMAESCRERSGEG